MKSYRYIQNQKALTDACPVIEASSWAALDTEADSLHHYVEKLCLLQVAVQGEIFVLDTLAGFSIEPLIRILNRKFLILHGADFDVRMLKRVSPFAPQEIFDTLLSAQLLGYTKKSLADLAQRHCGVLLPKSFQKVDWSKRPLEEAWLAYAADDVRYLKPIADAMKKELSALGRVSWHAQMCARLLEMLSAPAEELPSKPRWQVKGSKDLTPKALALLKLLWHWREEEAQRVDRPSFKILGSEHLVEIAQWAVEAPGADVAMLPKAPRSVRQRYRDVLNRLIEQGRHLPELQWTLPPRSSKPRKRWGPKESQRLEVLKKEREVLSLSLGIEAGVLATNAVLESIVLAHPKTREGLANVKALLPWQVEVLAGSILKEHGL